ncbi:uncharacterized protein BDZ99DRAFT_477202 [Mytilinidion resinicola]|uniref:Uncharacterized protein n=1 Tax=Mytilinidion resinicola TaxID=574789 RepID=A0A6A6YMP9_9PEZI|nr:uncharacterized protein BDZ99DRAFT_477202 [Mytilinidion resinicola]KAF2809843.1 hypothetical protein BDZ99DRAFT_477202 [Mytilinidion resinicola]
MASGLAASGRIKSFMSSSAVFVEGVAEPADVLSIIAAVLRRMDTTLAWACSIVAPRPKQRMCLARPRLRLARRDSKCWPKGLLVEASGNIDISRPRPSQARRSGPGDGDCT